MIAQSLKIKKTVRSTLNANFDLKTPCYILYFQDFDNLRLSPKMTKCQNF